MLELGHIVKDQSVNGPNSRNNVEMHAYPHVVVAPTWVVVHEERVHVNTCLGFMMIHGHSNGS